MGAIDRILQIMWTAPNLGLTFRWFWDCFDRYWTWSLMVRHAGMIDLILKLYRIFYTLSTSKLCSWLSLTLKSTSPHSLLPFLTIILPFPVIHNLNLTLFPFLSFFLLPMEQSIDGVHEIPHFNAILIHKCFKIVDSFGEGQSIENILLFEVLFERNIHQSVVSVALDDVDELMDHFCLGLSHMGTILVIFRLVIRLNFC